MHRGYTTPLVIAIMAFAIVAFLFLIDTAINPDGSRKSTNTATRSKNTNTVVCTLEAKLCPDGSFVGRSGPKCEFTECPTTNANSSEPSNSNSTPPCTADAVLCPDGTWVGRSGPKCEFTKCPTTNTNSTTNQNTNTSTDPTAGWKTYTNTQLKYSIQYPSDWTVGLETDKQTTISGAGTGAPFTAPSVSITTSEPSQPSSCLLKEETVVVLGESRLRQTQGCGYAGSSIATFVKRGASYLTISWSEDVQAEYPTYETMLSTFTFTD